jgi:endogenous inhibitor of DNA gyrase (YacG/DUF329 family)
MARIFCPSCRQEFDTEKSPALPFCSHRCRLIDLGHWLNEEISMPIERDRELDRYHIERAADREED